jgi:hypothetical protein
MAIIGASSNPEAAAEYIASLRQATDGVNGVFRAVTLLMFALILTIFSQRLELRSYQRQKSGIDGLLGLPWTNVRTLYEEMPDDYLRSMAQPWYDLCLTTVAVDIGLSAKLPTLQDKFAQNVLAISKTEGYLSTYNADLRSVMAARKMSVGFEGLTPEQLQALLRVMTFKMQPTEKEFRDGLLRAQASVVIYKHLEKDLRNRDPKRTLFEPSTFRDKVLDSALTLPQFETLASVLFLEDYKTFTFLSGDEPEALQGKLAPALASGRIPTLGAMRTRQASLQTSIDDLENNSTVHVPFIDLAMPLSTFGIFATVMNAALLGSLGALQSRIHRSILLARRFSPSPNLEQESAILSGVLFGSFPRWSAAILRAVVVGLPSMLGVYFVGATYKNFCAISSAAAASIVIIATAVVMFGSFDRGTGASQ